MENYYTNADIYSQEEVIGEMCSAQQDLDRLDYGSGLYAEGYHITTTLE